LRLESQANFNWNYFMNQRFTFSLLLLLALVQISFGQDSTKTQWEFHGNIQLNNNGISPVPAFSLGKPALMTTFAIKKGRFSFSPEYNMSWDARPWVINEWFRYLIPNKKSYYQIGANFSQFFIDKKGEKNQITSKMNRYVVGEAMFGTSFNEHVGVRLTYWISGSLDFDGVKQGHFIMASLPISKLGASEGLNINLSPNLFYINNTIPFKGVFTSLIGNVGYKKIPVRLFGQAIQPIHSDGSAYFNWNFGLNYSF
jgi:hypothetical protein